MCEIAAVNPNDAQSVINLSKVLYQTNPDGLGIVSVRREDGEFTYRIVKTGFADNSPDWEGGVRSFIENEQDEAWRFIVHARAATHGGQGFDETHPINVSGCPACDGLDLVLHNGIVRTPDVRNDPHPDHDYHTGVDSEVIAHEIGEMPDDLGSVEDDDDPMPDVRLRGSLNYFVFGPDGILVHNDGKYTIQSDLQVACTRRDWTDSMDEEQSTGDRGYHLFTPDGGHQFRTEPRRTVDVSSLSSGSAAFGTLARQFGRLPSQADSDSSRDGRSGRASGRTGGARRKSRSGRYASRNSATVDDSTGDDQQRDLSDTTHSGWVAGHTYTFCRRHDTVFLTGKFCRACHDEMVTGESPLPATDRMPPVVEPREGVLYSTDADQQMEAMGAPTTVSAHRCPAHGKHLGHTCSECASEDDGDGRAGRDSYPTVYERHMR